MTQGMGRPLFSAGTARGGTNLLAYCLSAHPQASMAADPYLPLFRSLRNAILRQHPDLEHDPASPIGEYYFSPERLRVMDAVQAADLELPVDQAEWPVLLGALRQRASLTCPYLLPHLEALRGRTYAELFGSALACLHTARKAGGRSWLGFNENWTVEFFTPLARAFPDAKFLIILRDPRASISSNRRVPNPALIAHAPSFARHWRKAAAFALHFQADPLFAGRLHVLTYEQLVLEPERTAQALCTFLKLDYNPAMLDTSRYTDLAAGEAWKGNSTSAITTTGIDPTRIDRWRRYLPEEVAKAVEWICDPDMRLFGYQPVHDSTVPDPAILEFLQAEHLASRNWRTDFQGPQRDFACELSRKSVLTSADRPDASLIRQTCLFPEVYERLKPAAIGVPLHAG